MANKNEKKARRGAGYNGHPLRCDCEVCAKMRTEDRVKLWRLHGAAAPLDPRKTVFVKSFWRAQRNHLNKLPNSRKALIDSIRKLNNLTRG
jgi:hypothetical protein